MVNERLDSELSATARQIIADARGADDPSAEDEARVKARWLAGIAAGAGVSSLTEAVRAAAGTGWGLKAAAMLAAAAAASVGVYLGWPESKHDAPAPTAVAVRAPATAPLVPAAEPPVVAAAEPSLPAPAQPAPSVAEVAAAAPALAEPVVPAPAAPQAAAPEAAAPEAEVAAAPAAAAATPAPVASVTPPRAVPSAVRPRAVSAERAHAVPVNEGQPAASAQIGGQLGEEIALLSEIRGALQDGAAARALQQLNEYRHRFERPSLAMEADALHVDALCRVGQREAAQAAAAAFVNDWPGSPLQQRVSSACP